ASRAVTTTRRSPDDQRVAVAANMEEADDTAAYDLWLIDLARGIPSRFTFGPAPRPGRSGRPMAAGLPTARTWKVCTICIRRLRAAPATRRCFRRPANLSTRMTGQP